MRLSHKVVVVNNKKYGHKVLVEKVIRLVGDDKVDVYLWLVHKRTQEEPVNLTLLCKKGAELHVMQSDSEPPFQASRSL